MSCNLLKAQGSIFVRTNLQLAMDAEGYWIGPQAGLGLGIRWPSGWGMMAEYDGFRDKVDISAGNWFEKGSFRQQTLAFMGSYTFGKRKDRGMYLMSGLAYQVRKSEFENPLGPCPDNRDFVTPAFELGHRWPVSKSGYGISASIKFTGPISYENAPHIETAPIPETNTQYPYYYPPSSTTEILTQLSVGIVVDRLFSPGKKKPAK